MTHGMVTAPQPEAVEAGLDTLKSGGNVMDAAITAALVQTVVDPQMCGVAGFGSMQIYQAATGEHQYIDFHGRAPKATRDDMWESMILGECDDGFGFILEGQVNEIGYTSMTTPMTLKALAEGLDRYGTWSLTEALQPAIQYCEEGFAVRPAVHGFWQQPAQAGRIERVRVIKDDPESARIYLKQDGSLYQVGDIFKNPDMGRTYRRLAEAGVEDFYAGEIAHKIDADMRKNGGLITLEDLADCKTNPTVPLTGSYRGFEVATNQLPGGGLMILEMLNILENFDLAAMGHNSPNYIAAVSEAMKIATVDKDQLMGDPNFIDVPMDKLTSKDYAAQQAKRIREGEKRHVPRVNSGAPESKETTHICVADEDGNVVNMTHSLGASSGVVSEGLGFMYNNCMMVFDPRPGRPGSLAPGKARFSAMCPTMLFNEDKPFLALGAPGGTTITMGVLQTILNVVDFDMTAQEAVSAPRFCATSDTIELTNRILRSTEKTIRDQGYPTVRYAVSYATPIVHAIRMKDGKMDGGADPSGDGMAAQV
ncbi:MAG: gamma-glutamyltransferase [Proteobacteria bacterium]|nr:gamma-glutamyltransferase [Pseudomonadota bacterium]